MKRNAIVGIAAGLLLGLAGVCFVSPVLGQQDDPKLPEECSGCVSGYSVIIPSNGGCDNCYRADAADCLRDPECDDPDDPHWGDNPETCTGWEDDPKCESSGSPVCPTNELRTFDCNKSADCCRTAHASGTTTTCQMVEVGEQYYGCLCDEVNMATVSYTVCK